MTIQEGLKLKGRWIEIPDTFRDDLPQFFKDRGYKVGAEVGVYKGEFTRKLCQAGLKVYAVDAWTAYDEYNNFHKNYQSTLDWCYEKTKRLLKPYNCEIIKDTSMNAVKRFEDESLNFCYLDGNHQLKYVVQDICDWTKKVKKGGVVSGHDYFYGAGTDYLNSNHVRYAVDAYVGAYQIDKLYILGKRKVENRDKWRSWFFIK